MVWYHKLGKKRVLDFDASPAPLGAGPPLTSWPAAGVRGEPRPEASFWTEGQRWGDKGGNRGDLGALPGLAGMKGWSQVGRPREKTPLALVLGWKIHSHPQQEPWYTTSHTHRCSERENINRETLTWTFLYMITHTHAHTHTLTYTGSWYVPLHLEPWTHTSRPIKANIPIHTYPRPETYRLTNRNWLL